MAPPLRSRTSRRLRSPRHAPEQARSMIIEAAVRFLSERPFRDLSVGRLMAGTELSRPAFYQYFRDLHGVLESLLQDLAARIGARANPWLVGEGDPEATLREALRGVVEVCLDSGALLSAITAAAPNDARLERAWSTFMGHWDDLVAARIEEQQAMGIIPAFDARSMANALNALDAAVLTQAATRRPRQDPEEVLETLYRIWAASLYGRSLTRDAPAVTDPGSGAAAPDRPCRRRGT